MLAVAAEWPLHIVGSAGIRGRDFPLSIPNWLFYKNLRRTFYSVRAPFSPHLNRYNHISTLFNGRSRRYCPHSEYNLSPHPPARGKQCLDSPFYHQLKTQFLVKVTDPDERDDMLAAIIQGSILTWQHVNMQGEYDFTRNVANEGLFDLPGILALTLAWGNHPDKKCSNIYFKTKR